MLSRCQVPTSSGTAEMLQQNEVNVRSSVMVVYIVVGDGGGGVLVRCNRRRWYCAAVWRMVLV